MRKVNRWSPGYLRENVFLLPWCHMVFRPVHDLAQLIRRERPKTARRLLELLRKLLFMGIVVLNLPYKTGPVVVEIDHVQWSATARECERSSSDCFLDTLGTLEFRMCRLILFKLLLC